MINAWTNQSLAISGESYSSFSVSLVRLINSKIIRGNIKASYKKYSLLVEKKKPPTNRHINEIVTIKYIYDTRQTSPKLLASK
jgi:hypothetical protein